MPKTTNITNSFALFGKSYNAINKQLKYFLALWFVPFTNIIVTYFWTIWLTRSEPVNSDFNFDDMMLASNPSEFIGFFSTIAVATLIIGLLIQTATIALELEAAQNNSVTWKYLWEQTKHYALRFLGLGIVIVIAVFAGLLFFIVPGIIILRKFILAPYAMIDKDLSIIESLRYSSKISKPYSKSVYSVLAIGLLLYIISWGGFLASITSFILMSLYSVAYALRYEELKKLTK